MQWHKLQSSFTGGVISDRMLARYDHPATPAATLLMQNFVPTIQGTAVRTPGTRFMELITNTENEEVTAARLIPFQTPDLQQGLVYLTDGDIKLTTDINKFLTPSGPAPLSRIATRLPVQIVKNFTFMKGLDDWTPMPEESAPADGVDATFGAYWVEAGNMARLHTRDYQYPQSEPKYAEIKTSCSLPQPNNMGSLEFKLAYSPGPTARTREDFDLILTVVDDNDRVIYEQNFSDRFRVDENVVFTVWEEKQTLTFDSDYEGDLHIKLSLNHEGVDQKYCGGISNLFYCRVWVDRDAELGDQEINGEAPWTADELNAVQYVQSPYNQESVGGKSKALVLVHPNHRPHWLYYNFQQNKYVLEEIPFVKNNVDGAPEIIPNGHPDWSENNYPAACTSFNGRLILAGSQSDPVYSDEVVVPVNANSETVWGTEVGRWNKFSIDDVDAVNPDDSIEFTAIYRSPIQWVYGQKQLLVGAREMEYIAEADGIFAPGDLGVNMHSTHGGVNVQPVGFGETVMFAAEGGRRLRAISPNNQKQGWVAPDLTVWNPEILQSGVRRMVRLRNPHQILVCLLNSGRLALLHYDIQNNVDQLFGWSTMDVGTEVKDIAVLPDTDGFDTLYMSVMRTIEGEKKLVLEAIPFWQNTNEGQYLNSSRWFLSTQGPTNQIDNLEHLEGLRAQVVGDGSYLGVFRVKNGRVVLKDQIGNPINVVTALVGRPMTSRIMTLPIIPSSKAGADPGAKMRYSDLEVWVRDSTSPKIGTMHQGRDIGVWQGLSRPADRSPQSLMDQSEPLKHIAKYKVANTGWNSAQVVLVEENLPMRCEILAIYGKMNSNSV